MGLKGIEGCEMNSSVPDQETTAILMNTAMYPRSFFFINSAALLFFIRELSVIELFHLVLSLDKKYENIGLYILSDSKPCHFQQTTSLGSNSPSVMASLSYLI
jgi:hypothetical protein